MTFLYSGEFAWQSEIVNSFKMLLRILSPDFMSWNFQSLLYNVKINTGDGTSLIFLFY